ncbi:MAG: hypothetical protein JWO30_596 [Fibrobacteres bacterium]|nr:hypothetical protein [Fibrobacterota bacterium]
MTSKDFREKMEKWWEATDARAMAQKASQGALVELMKLYKEFDSEEKVQADQVLIEWINSKNEKKKFDALAMIDHFKIRSALKQLHVFQTDATQRTDPEAPFDLKKVNRILKRLEE